MDSSSVIDISSSTTSTRTGLPSGLSSSVRPWGEVVVMVNTLSGPSESTLSTTCDFPEKPTGTSQAAPGKDGLGLPPPSSRRSTPSPGHFTPLASQPEQPRPVVVADGPQPLLPEAQPLQGVQLMDVRIRDVGEVAAQQDPVAEVAQPGQRPPRERREP